MCTGCYLKGAKACPHDKGNPPPLRNCDPDGPDEPNGFLADLIFGKKKK